MSDGNWSLAAILIVGMLCLTTCAIGPVMIDAANPKCVAEAH